MRAHVLLCDHAQVENNKLFISGAGISRLSMGAPMSLAVLIYVPWDLTNQRISARIDLEDADGRQVFLPTDDGNSTPLVVEHSFEVGRPVGVPAGADLEVPFALNAGPLRLHPGRYQWRLTINGEVSYNWTASFDVLEPAPQ